MPPALGDPSADGYLDALVGRLRSILGPQLTGAWLVNSGARDDYLPGRSDLDVAVGVTDALAAETKQRIAAAVAHAALPCPAPRLELVVYRCAVLAAPGLHPAFELNLNTGPAIADHVAYVAADDPSHWFVLDLAAARERSRALVGPSLDDLLAPIPDGVVLEALRGSAAWHAENDTATPNRVLNACRAWRWLVERRWSSKSEAAAWAIRARGDRQLIEAAMARRRGDTGAPLDAARIAAFVAAIDSRVGRASR